MEQIIEFILYTVLNWGYLGIFLLMIIESSFIPFPSEIVIIPAGYLAAKGQMDISLIILAGTLGSLVGALFNYYLAMLVGYKFLHKYGKYFFIGEDNLNKAEMFFRKHGVFATFTGRLLPVIRQLISIPAGIAKMNMAKFCFYTSLGAGIWVVILVILGYFVGSNEMLLKEYLKTITVTIIAAVIIALFCYIKIQKKRLHSKKS